MIDVVRPLLESSPLLALFLAIAAGYAIGQISIAGVSFGAGAVLFTGLAIAIGAVAPKSARPAMVGTLGLVMLVYGVGVQYGAQFFASLRGFGVKYMTLTAVAVVASLGVAIAVAAPLGVSLATAAGLFAGAGGERGPRPAARSGSASSLVARGGAGGTRRHRGGSDARVCGWTEAAQAPIRAASATTVRAISLADIAPQREMVQAARRGRCRAPRG